MEKYNHFAYQNADPAYYAQLKAWAREMRKAPTEAEAVLRNRVRANSLGHKFLFQYVIGQYIVDFLCPDCKLIIEVDGEYHADPWQQDDDEQRSRWLEQMGYRVIRFSNEQVLKELDNVIREISNCIKQQK
ncbi:MAG: endonuclease domain-containing protein [Bacteroidaceae bacterium]|nr:endonuclease domain-containing protein [Bacteroidaceae bacterium]